MNNQWNRLVYKAWSPVYDIFFNSPPFRSARKRIFQKAKIKKGSRVLLVGVGTGADLSYLLGLNIKISAVDLSKEMLAQARKKDPSNEVDFLEMDAQRLSFPEGHFDAVIANLILSVVPDAGKCFSEMVRVTKHGGQIIIMDKFASRSGKLPKPMVFLRPIIAVMGTDIGRSFEQISSPYQNHFTIQIDEGVMLGGMYRGILLQKGKAFHEGT
ncbi:class I SAM-dependent methyltransferase [Paenibacillus durus]|uniref:Phosphatidylethanolamine N-methyltransferase n=1 Tax=Paenibacillus durus ATCC 35681 TaxID=1333534 RepID=A0A0F7CIR9_PAEDU|nr:class I SAM-dependent methyltransferase [Paenibacillus durus]AKG35601.1 phosphatidylethanolamine N-methyltransferase [Paenibacillus durus ATCC 35681]